MKFIAPGKVVLVGEYAVLDGSPAIVAAVDRGVQCEVWATETLEVDAPGDARYVRAALQAVDAPPFRYVFSDWNASNTATKAGLGGSAAATVCACLAGSPGLQPPELQAVAHRVHAEVQGSGSGIDVAAAAHGGVIRFEAGLVQALDPVDPVVVFSGTSAATGPRVLQYLAADRGTFPADSAAIVAGFESDPIQALREACLLLEDMTERAGILWWTPGLRAIVGLAERFGGAAKPSGAGGGDSAIALFHDPANAAAFRTACTEAGLIVIPTAIAPGACRL